MPVVWGKSRKRVREYTDEQVEEFRKKWRRDMKELLIGLAWMGYGICLFEFARFLISAVW